MTFLTFITFKKDVENFQITTDKIKKRFDSINNVEIKESNLELEQEEFIN